MEIKDATVWHNYTIGTPSYTDSESLALKLITTGVFSSILTSSNSLYYLKRSSFCQQKLEIVYSNDFLGLTATGLDNINLDELCDFTKLSFLKSLSVRLSHEKIMHLQGDFFSRCTIGFLKPFFIDGEDDNNYLIPMIRVYEIGITQVTFLCYTDFEGSLKEFIDEKVGLPQKKLNYIAAPISYVMKHLEIETESTPFIMRKKFKGVVSNYASMLHLGIKAPNVDGINLKAEYTDYAGILGIEDSISDVARHIAAIVNHSFMNKRAFDIFKSLDRDSLYGYWEGKPNIFVIEHENQQDLATLNSQFNEGMINALLAKTSLFIEGGRIKKHLDHRAFDDYNFFSEPGVCLTVLSKRTYETMAAEEAGAYTADDLMMDSLVKGNMRDLAAAFFEIKSSEIRASESSMSLAKTREDLIDFEEWLRVTSRRFGEIRDYVASFLNDSDIKSSINNMNKLLKAKTEVMKLREAEFSEKTSKRSELIFGLIACTSLTPVIVPMLKGSAIDSAISLFVPGKFKDGFYLATIMLVVLVMIFIRSKNKK